jgi:hypothetical protein
MQIQKLIAGTFNSVACGKCGKPVCLNNNYDSAIGGGIIGAAWFDPYIAGIQFTKGYKGAQVHYDCLSEKRKKEIQI